MVDLHKDGNYPKTYAANMEWRVAIRLEAEGNVAFQKQLIERCRNDILFFFNAFVFIFEPRTKKVDGEQQATQIPFTTWEHQDPCILEFQNVIEEQESLGAEKSRGEGATWMVLMVFLWFWLFSSNFLSFGMVSRNEQASDNPEDPDSLGWKLDFAIANLPRWMIHLEKKEPKQASPSVLCNRSARNHTWANRLTRSTITAYTTTGDLARGGRKTAFLLDEMASYAAGDDEAVMSSMVEVTDCVIMVSTPQGPRGAYYKAMKEDGSDSLLRKLWIHWTQNPVRNRGLYTVQDNVPVAVDPINNPLPEGYAAQWLEKYRKLLLDRGYKIDDCLRSPWYDKKCLRPRMTPKFIAQEYDIDYGGATSRFFPIAMLERLQGLCTPPLLDGEIDFNHETCKPTWRESQHGHLLLWIELTAADRPPQGVRYIAAADVSTGQGGAMGSNSTLSIVERDTGRKVGEFAHPGQAPELFAMQTIAICYWFNDAYLIWEDNGPGKTFGNNIRDLGYLNVFFREITSRVSREKTKTPGFTTQKRNKGPLLSAYSYALGSGMFANPSYVALEEAKGYEEFAGGKIVHTASIDADPSGAGENHGDRCFVAGTRILTDQGERAIETIKPGDRVLTRNGYRVVTHASKTSDASEVFSATLDNGRVLTGTATHPVWTDKGWVGLASLTPSCKLFALSNAEPVSMLTIERLSERQPVYNFSVAEVPEYFAEGVLVHNCIADALANHALMENPLARRKVATKTSLADAPPTSFAGRRFQHDQDMKKANSSLWADRATKGRRLTKR